MTFVETFIATEGDPSKIDLALGEIEHFFNQTLPRAALRLCCVGLSGRPGKKSPSWATMDNLVRDLFEGAAAESIVDKHKIKRFAHSLHDQREPKNLHAYIGLLVSHMLSVTPNLKKESAIAEGLAVFNFVDILERYCSSRDREQLNIPPARLHSAQDAQKTTPVSAPGVRLALGVGKQDLREIGQRFFSRHGQILDEESYYACYRFSMSEPEIVKTYLKFCSPTSQVDRFTFQHIYEFETESGSKITKVADGEVMHLESAFYFLGASKRRLESKTERAQGIKLIAVPDHSLVPEPRLLSGLFMSASLRGEPIVGRLALLHLGYSKKRKIAEADVRPRVITSLADFSKDLMEASLLGYAKPLPGLKAQVLRYMSNKALSPRGRRNFTQAIAALPSKEQQG